MNVLPAILLILLVALGAWFLRRRATADSETVSMPGEPEPLEGDEDDATGDLELAITSEGEVLVPFGHSLRVVPLGDASQIAAHREDIEAGLIPLDRSEQAQLARMRTPGSNTLTSGDFTAARILRGAAGVVAWRLETLGRDGDYGFLPFETEDGARTALALLERFEVVKRPLDDEGRPIPASSEDFEEARRRYEETERELSLGGDGEPGDEPRADWSSRR